MLLAAGLTFIAGILAIAFWMGLLKRISFLPFVLYRMALGGFLLVLVYASGGGAHLHRRDPSDRLLDGAAEAHQLSPLRSLSHGPWRLSARPGLRLWRSTAPCCSA